MYDYLIIGAGFASSVVAERLATQKNKKVHIIERRDHVDGNCYDEIDRSGVIVHRYGPHLFHTDESRENYHRYAALAKKVDNLILLGRLAEYRCYDMDDIIERALGVFEGLE